MAKPSKSQTVTIDGHRLTLSNLDKVLYPETATTKRDVLAYYAAIAPVLLPHASRRPATRKRWVNGVGTASAPEQPFFQKDLEESAPDWVPRHSIQHKDHVNVYPLINDLATLSWLGQVAALEIHVPQWQFSRRGVAQNPDRLVIDLDPGEGVSLRDTAGIARLVRVILRDMGMDPVPVTSGSKGIHLYSPLDGSVTADQATALAKELARAMEADHPDLVVSDMKKALRGGKVLIDWSQNRAAKTTIAPYSLRGRLRPTVAAPRTWGELASPQLGHLEFPEVLRRVAKRGDPMAVLLDRAAASGTAGRRSGPLAEYYEKREVGKTPEPLPESVRGGDSGRSFVIQEHHASSLHYDFRLERDGVLASWAVPKGVPTTSGTNHLAVEVEDHPLEYGTFEGTIPKGEYGAGTVTIWDSGRYVLEKWRDDEIIVTLHGEQGGRLGGPSRLALIRTTGEGEKSNWLLHRMKEPAAARFVAPDRRRTVTASAPPKPMLASPAPSSLPTPRSEWAIEMKWDGYRAIATVRDGVVGLTSRNGVDLLARFSELAGVAASLSHASAVIDGEIVALDARGRPDFALLQNRSGFSRSRRRDVDPVDARIEYYAFDILEIDGESLADRPYTDRRTALQRLLSGAGPLISVPPVWKGSLAKALDSSRQRGLEGIVLKRRDSVYRPGERSADWIKVKHTATQEIVIGGWRPGTGARSGTIGALLMGIPNGTSLDYIGRVGIGFTDRELQRLMTALHPLERKTSPFSAVPAVDADGAHWVRPTLVGEVSFAEWSPSGRLRQPSWRGLRADKTPGDVVREDGGG